MSKQKVFKRRKSDKAVRNNLRVVIVGHVDHGKSTLIGRLLHDTGSLPDGKLEELQEICKRRGTDVLEWSFVLDAFQAERDQAITIDTTQIGFSSSVRDYMIIDAPGHREFLKNMISGAAAADAAVLVVDAHEGVREQTRRHAYMLSLLGLPQLAVVVNKMDMVGYSQERFDEVSVEITDYLESIGLTADTITPISAREGDMIQGRGESLDWYDGGSLIDVLDSFHALRAPTHSALRFPVQDVYRYDEERILVGRVETGVIRTGDTVLFSPSNEEAVVTSVRVWPDDGGKVEASAGQSIGITLDQPIFAERGHVVSHVKDAPMLSNVFQANIFWLGVKPLQVGSSYKIRFGTHEAVVNVQSIDRVIDADSLDHEEDAAEVVKNAAAVVTLRGRDLLPLDSYSENGRTGRIVIYDGYDIAGGGTISMEEYPDQRVNAKPKSENIHRVDHFITEDVRAQRNGHRGGVFWFTGLSGSGKSTTAMAVEKALFEKGYRTYVLDGDNVRHGLNADLGFSPDDRAENIRRIGEVAALMADAGLVVVTAFISPYLADREKARKAAPERFHEIFVKADLATCEGRDPKGLYKKARAGEIEEFTGIDSPYEAPENPELVVDTQNYDVEKCVEQVVDYIEHQIGLKSSNEKDESLAING